MKAAAFVEPGRIVIENKPIPGGGALDMLTRTAITTICGTDVHILKGEHPMEKGLTIGREPMGGDREVGIRRARLGRRAACYRGGYYTEWNRH